MMWRVRLLIVCIVFILGGTVAWLGQRTLRFDSDVTVISAERNASANGRVSIFIEGVILNQGRDDEAIAASKQRLVTSFLVGGSPDRPVVLTKQFTNSDFIGTPVLVDDPMALDFDRYKGYGFPKILRAGESFEFEQSFGVSIEDARRLGNAPRLVTLVADPDSISDDGFAEREAWIEAPFEFGVPLPDVAPSSNAR